MFRLVLVRSHSLDVFITAQGITAPLGNPLGVLSGFTENTLIDGFTVTLSTFLSSANALFTGTALSSQAFGAPGTVLLDNRRKYPRRSLLRDGAVPHRQRRQPIRCIERHH